MTDLLRREDVEAMLLSEEGTDAYTRLSRLLAALPVVPDPSKRLIETLDWR